MHRTAMRDYLNNLSLEDRLPVYIISYKRAGLAPNLEFINDNWARADDVNVVVLQSEKAAYVAAYPRLTVHGLPDDQVNTVGKARWRAAELAHALGDEVIIMMDDDVLKLDFLHHSAHRTGKNAGAECSGLSNKEDRAAVPSLEERVVMGFGDTSRHVFEQEPQAVLGGMHKRHMSFSPRNHRTRYTVNGGASPRQVYVWHVDRMMQHGVALNTKLFSRHGDDIGLVAEVLKAGLDCFLVPSFVFDHWPESVNITKSVLRNAHTAPALHAEEWEALQQYPIKDYLRVKLSMLDGSYQWGDVDWRKLAKIRKQPTRHIAWDQALPPEGPYGLPDHATLI